MQLRDTRAGKEIFYLVSNILIYIKLPPRIKSMISFYVFNKSFIIFVQLMITNHIEVGLLLVNYDINS